MSRLKSLELVRSNKSIKKVIILEHPPRFDTKDKDPLSLKPEFAKYANTVYRQLWLASNLKDKIVLGKHNLDCTEKVRLDRFTDRQSKRYDGIHICITAKTPIQIVYCLYWLWTWVLTDLDQEPDQAITVLAQKRNIWMTKKLNQTASMQSLSRTGSLGWETRDLYSLYIWCK